MNTDEDEGPSRAWPQAGSPEMRPALPIAPVETQGVLVVGIRIPFWDLVGLLVKVSLAAIPAAIILAIVYAVIGGFVISLIGGILGHR